MEPIDEDAAGGGGGGGGAMDALMMDLPEASRAKLLEQQGVVEELEMKRKMKSLVVPTADAEVRALLRQLGEPVTLFGERQLERRDRLRALLAEMGEERAVAAATAAQRSFAAAAPAEELQELFYTEGPPELRAARLAIAAYSLPRAAARLAAARRARGDPARDEAAAAASTEAALRVLVNQSSDVADERPVVACRFSPSGAQLATGSWSGAVKVWSAPACHKLLTISAHAERVTDVAWHPEASAPGRACAALALASGSADTTARLWGADGRLLRELCGHTDRLGRIAFHPAGRHLATASFDLTWRLWDVETGACLAEQEGHSRAVYAVAFQRDGSLAASAGLDAFGRIWDVRTGRSIMVLEGHVKGVLALDFSPNGFHVATGALDNSARVFDLRRRGPLAVLPGHTALVSQVRFEPDAGAYLLTAGYDSSVKLWCGRRLRLTRALVGHEGKIMGADVAPGGGCTLATSGYDRTLKLYSPDAAPASLADE